MATSHSRSEDPAAGGWLAFALLAFGLTLAGLVVPRDGLPATDVDRAMELAGEGRDDAAIALLESVVQAEPRNVVARNNLAVLYAANGDLARARALLIEAMNSDARYALVYRNLTDIYDRFAALAYERALYGEGAPADSPLGLVAIEPDVALARAGAVPDRPPPEPANVEVVSAPAPETAPAPTPIPAPPPGPPGPPATSEPEGPAGSPAAAAPAESIADVPSGVLDVVEGWAAAWSAQDVDSYLRFYGPQFEVPKGMDRSGWEAQRQVRLRRPAFIEVKITDKQVRLAAPDRAEVRFRQTYRNDAFTSEVTKMLTLSRSDAGWEIVGEAVLR